MHLQPHSLECLHAFGSLLYIQPFREGLELLEAESTEPLAWSCRLLFLFRFDRWARRPRFGRFELRSTELARVRLSISQVCDDVTVKVVLRLAGLLGQWFAQVTGLGVP